ncbi:MAG: YlbL family protein [Nocardioides sp.]
MSRRTASSVLACALLVVLFGVAALLPVPYVTMSPGPTVDVLSETEGEEIVQIDGHEVYYKTDGRLELTTVSVTGPGQELSLAEAIVAWFDTTRAVYPRDVVYLPEQSEEEVRTESNVQMVSSQDSAIVVALKELGFDPPSVTEVLAVSRGAPAQGKLEARDKIVEVNGTKITDSASVTKAVQKVGVGGEAEFVVRRAGKTRTVSIETEAAKDDPERAIVGVVVGEGSAFPFDVSVNISDDIGGPSAGLIFSLAVYDTLTPGALTDGLNVAGTGTIAANGSVGPIGGIQQKIVAAADSGSDLFLVPPDNCGEALGSPHEDMRLVRTETMHDAVEAIEAWVEDPDATLPACKASS